MKPWMRWMVLGTLALLSGCASVGPNYAAPRADAPARWNGPAPGPGSEKASPATDLSRWWTAFDDPVLSGLIQKAVENNPDVASAVARIREARARADVAAAGRMPRADVSASHTWTRDPNNQGGRKSDLYSEGFDASWEADLFGGVRRSVEAATGQAEASVEDWRNAMVSLAAEVGSDYVALRTFQARLAVARENLRTQEDTRDLVYWRVQAGLASQLDLERADYQLAGTRAEVPVLENGVQSSLHRLAVLLGQAPGTLPGLVSAPGEVPRAPETLAVGIPAETLARRPDVRRAERLLAAQTARVGVAEADLYPRLAFSGSIGLDVLSAGGLLDSGNTRASFGPRLTWNLFNGGAVRGNIRVEDALVEQALLSWQGAVLIALREVEDALVAYAKDRDRHGYLVQAERSARAASALALDEYSSGISDFQAVLDAQQALLSFQDRRVQGEAALSTDLITLYKALGGGWTPETVPLEENRAAR